jgi:predicted house-cleaning noncanonical NTP pyrophosphatase (MazG superfamily)
MFGLDFFSSPDNKLVRDKIPEIIRQSGNQCASATLSEGEYLEALRQKLIEEANEAANAAGATSVRASPNELIKELADLYEVIDSLMAIAGIEKEVVVALQRERREQRGGFKHKIKLLWTEEISP